MSPEFRLRPSLSDGPHATALRGFRSYAEQGDASAQTNLGVMSANGEGVPENTVNAYAWFSIAAAQGNTSAKELKELVTGLMVRSQIAEAQGLALEYWNLYVLPFQLPVVTRHTGCGDR